MENITILQSGKGKIFCNKCGMHLQKFYKSNHAVEYKDNTYKQFCSIHCLVDSLQNSENPYKKIYVVDAKGIKFIDANSAYYVVGSKVRGTMSMKSKYAFKSKEDAIIFKSQNGGQLLDFISAFKVAKSDFDNDNIMIYTKRAKKMYKMGERIFKAKCNQRELKKMEYDSIFTLKLDIKKREICKNIKPKQIQAVALYYFDIILNNSSKLSSNITIPKNVKCSVCGMFVHSYSNWVSTISFKNHTHYFDGVKDMMKFYFKPIYYTHNHTKNEFISIMVSDYYTLNAIDAKSAFYVYGSNVYGPMGNELIAFYSYQSANRFKSEHFAKKILRFNEITEVMVKQLD